MRNIEATGEFTWNLATRPLAEAMNASAAMVPAEVDEFDLAGLQVAPSRLIGAPRVAASPVSFECRLSQLLPLQTAAGHAIETWLVLGEVVGVHLVRSALHEGIYDPAAVQTILRAGGPADYYEVQPQARFRMTRPGQ